MTNNNERIVHIPCIQCKRILRFRIRDSIVVEVEGRIACNIPGAVCPDCIESLLDRVADPPGLICIERLSPVLAQGLLESFEFLLPKAEALKFLKKLFPEI